MTTMTINWRRLGRELRAAAMDAHEGSLPPVQVAYSFLLDNPECFSDGDGDEPEWPADMPQRPPLALCFAYEGTR